MSDRLLPRRLESFPLTKIQSSNSFGGSLRTTNNLPLDDYRISVWAGHLLYSPPVIFLQVSLVQLLRPRACLPYRPRVRPILEMKRSPTALPSRAHQSVYFLLTLYFLTGRVEILPQASRMVRCLGLQS